MAGGPGEMEHTAGPGFPGTFLSKTRAKAAWLLAVPKSLRETSKQRRLVSEAKKNLMKALLRFLSACGLGSAPRSQPPGPGRTSMVRRSSCPEKTLSYLFPSEWPLQHSQRFPVVRDHISEAVKVWHKGCHWPVREVSHPKEENTTLS